MTKEKAKAFKIYCAGPLFNNKEKEEMKEIADALEKNAYRVFLPQRDGFEFANLFATFEEIGISKKKARFLLNKAIFTLDVYEILESDGLVLNINGRVPDEGAMVEAGIAWNAGKQIVLYKNDARTLLDGNDNPLLLGLSDFRTINILNEIPKEFDNLFDKLIENNPTKVINNSRLNNLYEHGRIISALAKTPHEPVEICTQLLNL